MDIRRGDTVMLRKTITGAQKGPKRTGGSAGKQQPGDQAKVLRVFPESDRVLVEGVRFIWKHQRPNQTAPKGAKIQKEAPIHVSNVQLVCPSCAKPTRVGHKRVDGRNVRTCKKCQAVIQAQKG